MSVITKIKLNEKLEDDRVIRMLRNNDPNAAKYTTTCYCGHEDTLINYRYCPECGRGIRALKAVSTNGIQHTWKQHKPSGELQYGQTAPS